MPAETRISDAIAVAACDATVDSIDAGGAGKVEFRAAPQPAGPDDVATGTLLATCVWPSAPAFAPAAMVGNDKAEAAVANVPDPDLNTVGGEDAVWARVYAGDTTPVMDGNVGVGSLFAFDVNTVTITAGGTMTINGMTHTVPTGGPA